VVAPCGPYFGSSRERSAPSIPARLKPAEPSEAAVEGQIARTPGKTASFERLRRRIARLAGTRTPESHCPYTGGREPSDVPEPVETTDPDGVDFGRVMQLTFVYTIVVGAPLVALVSIPFSLPTWGDRAEFAIRIGAIVWFVTSIAVYLLERRRVADS